MRGLDEVAFAAAMALFAPTSTPAERMLMFEDYCALQPLLDHLREVSNAGSDPVTFHAPLRFDDVNDAP
jgi:hypothetical protein